MSQLGQNKCNLYVISIYLPQQQCKISDYGYHIAQLELLIEYCSHDGEVVVIGDFNAHFGPEYGDRYWGQTTPNGRQVIKMIERQAVAIVDNGNMCTGPNYTFLSPGVGRSYVDHVVVTKALKQNIVSCRVISDTIDNTSDHLAIQVSLACSEIKPVIASKQQARIAWSKMTPEEICKEYTTHLM
jgi:hypothetical protein